MSTVERDLADLPNALRLADPHIQAHVYLVGIIRNHNSADLGEA